MESPKCCAHCRGKSIVWKSDDLHEDRRSERASGKPKSLSRKHTPECSKFRRISEEERRKEIASCAEKFSLAKRLHAENLQHQPLPDRVDDSVFKKGYRPCSASCERGAECQERGNVATRTAGDRLFRPTLGCKKPKTRMDLAICWETPVDPVYEPRRATHIDGSEGGSAPAIFALIQHTPAPRSRELLSRGREKDGCCDCVRQEEARKNPGGDEAARCCCDCSCEPRGDGRSGKLPRSNSVPRITERRCAACRGDEQPEAELERRRRDPRQIRSAVGVVLGLEERTTGDGGAARRDGLPPRMTVPRPRTPFARRAFCIDTLAPPFSVVNGCRDADYPEHWRLMSVYQQSYRNPQKRRTRRF